MEDLQHYQLLTSCTQAGPLHYGFGNIAPSGFFIISSRQQQYSAVSELWMSASPCFRAAVQPWLSSLDGFNPTTELRGMLPNFSNSTKVKKLPFPPHSRCRFGLVGFFFIICHVFFLLLNNSANRLVLERLRAVFPNEGSSLPTFYLSSLWLQTQHR